MSGKYRPLDEFFFSKYYTVFKGEYKGSIDLTIDIVNRVGSRALLHLYKTKSEAEDYFILGLSDQCMTYLLKRQHRKNHKFISTLKCFYFVKMLSENEFQGFIEKYLNYWRNIDN